jgi:hypothetical protein
MILFQAGVVPRCACEPLAKVLAIVQAAHEPRIGELRSAKRSTVFHIDSTNCKGTGANEGRFAQLLKASVPWSLIEVE